VTPLLGWGWSKAVEIRHIRLVVVVEGGGDGQAPRSLSPPEGCCSPRPGDS